MTLDELITTTNSFREYDIYDSHSGALLIQTFNRATAISMFGDRNVGEWHAYSIQGDKLAYDLFEAHVY